MSKKIFLLPTLAVGMLILAIVVKLFTSSSVPEIQVEASPLAKLTTEVSDSELRINISSLGTTAKFVDYTGSRPMQLVLVKDSSGNVKVVYNTCYTCNDSPYGYFIQEGDELVCQNCGTRHKIDELELEKFGCNPIPVKYTLDQDTVIISKSELSSKEKYFLKWKQGL